MQVVHQLPPQLLAHRYARHSLNGITSNPGPSTMPTPPVTARKRKRAHQYTVSYSEVQELDSDGRLREVIIIEDTPPPPTMSPATTHTGAFSASYQPPIYSAPIRTRARAAAEAQALSSSSSSAIVAPAPKKRKREIPEEVRAPATKKLVTSNQHTQQVIQTKSWDSRSAAATDDVCILNRHGGKTCSFFQTSKGPVSCDDKEGHYIIVPDDMIYRRCK
jgi:dual-specificity kinase